MAINLSYEKVLGVPLAPDAVSSGTTSILSFPIVVNNKYHSTGNLSVKTYTFDFRGVPENFLDSIAGSCETNSKNIALGQLDLTTLSGASGAFTYKGSTCIPISYSHSNSFSVGGKTLYSSVQLTCITDTFLGGV